jgi:GNAT acetyltransferase-like protein
MSGPFRVVQRKDLGRDEWDALADASDEAWLWHRYDLQDALETWPGSTDESFALMDPESGQALGLVPLRRITRRLASVFPLHVLESLGGVAVRNGMGERRHRAILKMAAVTLTEKSRKGICLETRVALPAMAPALRGENCPRVNPLLDMGCENTLTQTWVVDLRAGADAVWNQMEGRARTAVRKAEKAGVTVREATPSDLQTYYSLHQETYRRTGAVPHSKDYFAMIWDRFLSRGLARIWVAEHDGEPIAAENFGIYKKAAIYWTGAANSKSLDVEANSLLQWTAMQWMMRNGIEWYETGEAFPQFDNGKNKGLSDFKKSFGGSMYPYFKGNIPAAGIGELLYRYAQRCRE